MGLRRSNGSYSRLARAVNLWSSKSLAGTLPLPYPPSGVSPGKDIPLPSFLQPARGPGDGERSRLNRFMDPNPIQAVTTQRSASRERATGEATRRTPLQRSLKRLIDVSLGAVAGVCALPICVAIAVIIKLDSHGPVIFAADRIGEGGRRFKLYKFRSMVADAHKKLGDLAHLNEGGTFMIKIPNDPRVTRAGRVLRKYSLDEIPQLWNVIRGDMSLVGPRPQAPEEVAHYDDCQRRRLSVPAGITGLWQVTARNDPSFDVWVAKDLEYIDNWSIRVDLAVMLKTVFVVLAGKDAAPPR